MKSLFKWTLKPSTMELLNRKNLLSSSLAPCKVKGYTRYGTAILNTLEICQLTTEIKVHDKTGVAWPSYINFTDFTQSTHKNDKFFNMAKINLRSSQRFELQVTFKLSDSIKNSRQSLRLDDSPLNADGLHIATTPLTHLNCWVLMNTHTRYLNPN